MKKVISFKEIMIMLVSVVFITVSTSVYATGGLVLGDNNTPTISQNEYENAQPVPEDNNTANNTANNATDNTANRANTYNANNNNNSNLPQTGIQDYNIGILIIICIASAIFAYKKINDYKNV